MEQEPFNKKSIREDLFHELTNYLHSKNEQRPKRFEFLDRPFMLTLIGGLLISLITLSLQIMANNQSIELQYQRSRIDKKFELLRSFPSIFQNNYQLINDKLCFILIHYGEFLKPKDQQDVEKLKKWSALIKELEKEWREAEPMQGVLLQIEVLFLSEEVMRQANNMNKKWEEFIELVHNTTVKCNTKVLTTEGIADCEESRKKYKVELSELHNDLMHIMTKELNSNCSNNSCILPK